MTDKCKGDDMRIIGSHIIVLHKRLLLKIHLPVINRDRFTSQQQLFSPNLESLNFMHLRAIL